MRISIDPSQFVSASNSRPLDASSSPILANIFDAFASLDDISFVPDNVEALILSSADSDTNSVEKVLESKIDSQINFSKSIGVCTNHQLQEASVKL